MRLRRDKRQASTPMQLPGRAETVILSTPAGGRIPARISDLDRRRLVRFIFECQRNERRRGLQTEERDGS